MRGFIVDAEEGEEEGVEEIEEDDEVEIFLKMIFCDFEFFLTAVKKRKL